MRGDLMWICLVWAERSTPDNFWVPSCRFNSATGEQKRITQTIYTDSEPPSRMPNSLVPSATEAEKRKPPSFYVFGATRSGIEPRPPAPRADALTTMLRGGSEGGWDWPFSDVSNILQKTVALYRTSVNNAGVWLQTVMNRAWVYTIKWTSRIGCLTDVYVKHIVY